MKGKLTWDNFLRKIVMEIKKMKRENIKNKLRKLLELNYEEARINKLAKEFLIEFMIK